MPNVMQLGTIQKVFRRLLEERIPIRDLVTILEALADHGASVKNTEVLVEYTRAALAPTITRQFTAEDGTLHALVLDPVMEQHLLDKARAGEFNPNTLGLEPQRAEAFIQEADRLTKRMISIGYHPVLLTSPVLRPTLFAFLAPMLSDIAVLSYNDLVADASVEVVDQLKVT